MSSNPLRYERIRILLVDDDEEDSFIVRDLLSRALFNKFQLDWCYRLEDGYKSIEQEKYQVCLVDYRLGVHTGLEFIAECVRRGYKTPCILLTGYGDHEIDLRALSVGAADYLIKGSLNTDILERSIRYTIARHEQIENLRDRESALQSLFDASFEALLVYDLSGKIIECNKASEDLFKSSRENLIGEYAENFFPKDYLFVNTRNEAVNFKHEPTKLHLELNSHPFSFRMHQAFLVTIRDITSRVMLESQMLQQDRLASIGLLASGLAHEIGTPLATIRGRAEMLTMNSTKPESVEKNASIILSQIDRISKLVTSLLNLARGAQTTSPVLTDVSSVVRDVAEFLQHEFNKNKISVNVDANLPLQAMAISTSLYQVLLNLLVNATHAIYEKRLRDSTAISKIDVRVYQTEKNVEISIQDSGTGISEENMKKLFTPFFTTKEIGKGTGLGLVTSYRIIESWGGTLTVHSREGEGCQFVISLRKTP